jgi:SAM-dependent methyltransferase
MKARTEERTLTAVAYEALAFLYSRTMAEDFCRRALPAYRHLLLKSLPTNSHLLDLCCGTGQWARELTRLGYRVTGLDTSSSMIQLARVIAPAACFLVADARSFAFTRSFSGAVSAFNSLAHATNARDLLLIFRNVRLVLPKGAPFLFDLSMEEAYSSRWRGQFSCEVDGLTFTVTPRYDFLSRIAQNRISIATRDGDAAPNADFTIYQHCYSHDEIRNVLQLAEFHCVESFDAEEDLGIPGEYGRRFFLCR